MHCEPRVPCIPQWSWSSLVLHWFGCYETPTQILATRDTGRRARCRLTAKPTLPPRRPDTDVVADAHTPPSPLSLSVFATHPPTFVPPCSYAGSEHFGARVVSRKRKFVLVVDKAEEEKFRCCAPLPEAAAWVFASHVVVFASLPCCMVTGHRLHSRPMASPFTLEATRIHQLLARFDGVDWVYPRNDC